MKAWLVIGASIVVAVLFEEWVRLAAQNHPWRVFIVGGIALALAGVLLLLLPNGALIAATALVSGAWAVGLITGLDDRDHTLGYYCRYGATSQAELDACMERVNTDEIDGLDTPAARFARGETSDCGTGSGRFCAEAARENTLE